MEGIEALNVSEDTFRILRVSDHEVLAVNDKEAAHLKVVARGDFNGDGLDDILLETTFWKEPAETYDPLNFDLRQILKTGQFWVTSELYVLSRDGEDYPGDFLPAPSRPPNSVWWWPLLGVESRLDIDDLLRWQSWLTTDGTMLEIESAGEMVEVPAKSCRTLKKMLKRGYRLTADYRSHVSVIADCRTLELLRDARASKASHLRDFVLDEAAMDLLPQRLWAASADGDASAIEIADERTLEVRTAEGTLRIRFVAGGDFNGDGLDDVLVKREVLSDHPDAAVFVLSRDGPDAPLRVVSAELFRP